MGQTQNISLGIFMLLSLITIGVITYLLISEAIWSQKQIKKANEKCKEYNERACNLSGQSPPPSNNLSTIIDGDDAVPGQFPHQALIALTNPTNNNVTLCGGSLISEYFVLTAAGSIIDAGGKPKIQVLLGSVYSEFYTSKVLNVQEFHVYPGYTKEQVHHDIALLKLEKKVDFTSTIRPICLNTDYHIEKYYNATASGWGYTSETSKHKSPRLKMVQLRIDEYPKSTCGKYLRKFGAESQYIICTVNDGEEKSTYIGDNGGPLQVWSTGCSDGKTALYELLGVISQIEDEPEPGRSRFNIFMKVEPYIPWIANIVWP